MVKTAKSDSGNIILRMRPLQRTIVCLILAVIAFFIIPKSVNPYLIGMVVWTVFALSFLILSWIILFTRSVPEIRVQATSDDGGKLFVFIMVIASSFASMLMVLLLMVSPESANDNDGLFLGFSIAAMLLSWIMVHSIFTFHYAHMFYDNAIDDSKKIAEGLNFPQEKKPDYIDFAYFSFVIGCTFQVSDVEVTSRNIRRLVLMHGLISFGLNTFVVALTINLVAGLSK